MRKCPKCKTPDPKELRVIKTLRPDGSYMKAWLCLNEKCAHRWSE